jgi:6-phosphogluconolactonase
VKLEVLEDKDAVAARAAEILAAASGNVALAGGSTPKAAYELAAARRTDWRELTLWLGDERHVPFDSDDSNAFMVRKHLIWNIARSRLPTFEAVDTTLDLDAAAADYSERFGDTVLDLALMGLGPDAHTASLFPGKPALDARGVAVGVPEPGLEPRVPRVTLTFDVFNAARDVVFLVAGEDKAEAMERAFGPDPDPTAPAARVRPSDGRLLVLADRAAAARFG